MNLTTKLKDSEMQEIVGGFGDKMINRTLMIGGASVGALSTLAALSCNIAQAAVNHQEATMLERGDVRKAGKLHRTAAKLGFTSKVLGASAIVGASALLVGMFESGVISISGVSKPQLDLNKF